MTGTDLLTRTARKGASPVTPDPAPDVLLFAAQPLASAVAAALGREASSVTVVTSQESCLNALRLRSFGIVMIEESVLSADVRSADVLYRAAGSAMVLELNFGLLRAERVRLQLRSAHRRRARELDAARAAAAGQLQQELTASLTGLMLEAQLALHQAGPGQIPALERLLTIAEHICDHLQAEAHGPR